MPGGTRTLQIAEWIADELARGVARATSTARPVWWHAETVADGDDRAIRDAGWHGLAWGLVTPDEEWLVGLGDVMGLEAQVLGWRRLRRGFQQLAATVDVPPDWPWGGGFAFGRGRWPGFPAAAFHLPALTVAYRPGSALTVRLAARLEPLYPARRVIDMHQALWHRFQAAPPDWRRPRIRVEAESPDAERFAALVGQAERACRTGALSKVVLARSVTAEVAPAPAPEAIWRRIVEENPGTYRFFIRRGTRVFMGASPETLVEVHGGQVRTMCLAGTTARGAHEDLASSDKDRREHEWVRRHVQDRLARVATHVDMPEEPAVRWVGDIGHLFTPVTGTLKAGATLWDAAAALHPTPAVGGTPARQALDFIAREEAITRGWYAGGVGWVNLRGDGWLAVGLRSMLYDTLAARATLFAGVGIVAGSQPERELRETEWKLLPMLKALGGSLP
jgi:isochorismate synthase